MSVSPFDNSFFTGWFVQRRIFCSDRADDIEDKSPIKAIQTIVDRALFRIILFFLLGENRDDDVFPLTQIFSAHIPAIHGAYIFYFVHVSALALAFFQEHKPGKR